MSFPRTLSPEDLAKLDAAVEELKAAGRSFAGSHDGREVRFFLACLDLAEIYTAVLKAMPGALSAVHKSIEAERLRLNDTLRLGHETITALHRIDENTVRKQVIDLTSQMLTSLKPDLENRARLLNEQIARKQIAGLIGFTTLLTVFVFFVGRFSV